MKSLRIIPKTSLAESCLKKYIDSCINPSLKDKITTWKAKQVTKLVYKNISPPNMLREEFNEQPLVLSCIVEDSYIQYADSILEKAKVTYEKLFLKDNCDSNNFDWVMS